jgi:uncharacterized membrane-anchored protein YhcB (DUF1043 family)
MPTKIDIFFVSAALVFLGIALGQLFRMIISDCRETKLKQQFLRDQELKSLNSELENFKESVERHFTDQSEELIRRFESISVQLASTTQEIREARQDIKNHYEKYLLVTSNS